MFRYAVRFSEVRKKIKSFDSLKVGEIRRQSRLEIIIFYRGLPLKSTPSV